MECRTRMKSIVFLFLGTVSLASTINNAVQMNPNIHDVNKRIINNNDAEKGPRPDVRYNDKFDQRHEETISNYFKENGDPHNLKKAHSDWFDKKINNERQAVQNHNNRHEQTKLQQTNKEKSDNMKMMHVIKKHYNNDGRVDTTAHFIQNKPNIDANDDLRGFRERRVESFYTWHDPRQNTNTENKAPTINFDDRRDYELNTKIYRSTQTDDFLNEAKGKYLSEISDGMFRSINQDSNRNINSLDKLSQNIPRQHEGLQQPYQSLPREIYQPPVNPHTSVTVTSDHFKKNVINGQYRGYMKKYELYGKSNPIIDQGFVPKSEDFNFMSQYPSIIPKSREENVKRIAFNTFRKRNRSYIKAKWGYRCNDKPKSICVMPNECIGKYRIPQGDNICVNRNNMICCDAYNVSTANLLHLIEKHGNIPDIFSHENVYSKMT